jgi:hypothetical protein
VQRFLLIARNVILFVLRKPMQEDQTITLAMGDDGPTPAPFAPPVRADPLLDEEAPEPGEVGGLFAF